MAWRCRRCKIGRMALIAIRITYGITSVHMTGYALYRNVAASQCKGGRRMIECCLRPYRCRMAGGAIRGKIQRLMVRIRGLIILGHMALRTICVANLIIPGNMTRLAQKSCMGSGKWEPGRSVIKVCIAPR